jgi:hypothetical protein
VLANILSDKLLEQYGPDMTMPDLRPEIGGNHSDACIVADASVRLYGPAQGAQQIIIYGSGR